MCGALSSRCTTVTIIFFSPKLEKYDESYENYNATEVTQLYTNVDLLILKDLGEETIDRWMLSKLFVIVNERMKNGLPIIITTNYDLEQLREKLSRENEGCEIVNSIISRLYKMCDRVDYKKAFIG